MDNLSPSGYGYTNYKNPPILDESFTKEQEKMCLFNEIYWRQKKNIETWQLF